MFLKQVQLSLKVLDSNIKIAAAAGETAKSTPIL